MQPMLSEHYLFQISMQFYAFYIYMSQTLHAHGLV